MATSTIKGQTHRITIVGYTNLEMNNGYCLIPYPSGYSDADIEIISPMYDNASLLGWSATIQRRTSDVVLYIRQGTATPANGSKVSFKAIFIKE